MTDMQVLVEDPENPTGWLALEQASEVLTLTADTFAQASITLKRTTVSNPLVPGTYTVRALPDTTTETIGVFIRHPDPKIADDLATHLIDLFSRVRYTLRWIHDSLDVLMTGQAADYTRSTIREFRHAGVIQLTFSVPVLPDRRVL